MGFAILVFLLLLCTASTECAVKCDDTAQLLRGVFDCFPKEFINLQGIDLTGEQNLTDIIRLLDEDDGYKYFYYDYKSAEKGCKKTTPQNVITCYLSIMANCELDYSKADVDDLYRRYEAFCNNSRYLSEQQCCLRQSYVYQTPCYRSEFIKLRSGLNAAPTMNHICSFQTCTLGCMKQALNIAKCDEKVVEVVSALFKPTPVVCKGVPQNATFDDCAESKYIEHSVVCAASSFCLSLVVMAFTALSVLIYLP